MPRSGRNFQAESDFNAFLQKALRLGFGQGVRNGPVI
jgi:hypothetical protein